MKKSKVIIITVAALLLLSSAFLMAKPQKPVFPGTTIDIDYEAAKVEFKLSNEELDTKMPVYRVSKMKIKNSEVQKLLAAFSFENPEKERRSGNTYYTEGEKELVIYASGSYRYTNKNNGGESDFLLTEEWVKNDAEKFLDDNGLLPDDFSFDGYFTTEQSGGSSSGITEIGIVFEKRLDTHEVVGPAAQIILTYNENGLVSLEGNNIKYSKKMSAKCDTIEGLKDKALSEDALISCDETEMKKVSRIEFTDWKIIYYDGKEVNKAKDVQPCIVFIGTAFDDEGDSTKFSSTVPMLK